MDGAFGAPLSYPSNGECSDCDAEGLRDGDVCELKGGSVSAPILIGLMAWLLQLYGSVELQVAALPSRQGCPIAKETPVSQAMKVRAAMSEACSSETLWLRKLRSSSAFAPISAGFSVQLQQFLCLCGAADRGAAHTSRLPHCRGNLCGEHCGVSCACIGGISSFGVRALSGAFTLHGHQSVTEGNSSLPSSLEFVTKI